jgi:hypothetical protein
MRGIIEGFFVTSPYNDKHVSTAKAVKLNFDLDKKEGFVRYTCTGKLKTENILNIFKKYKEGNTGAKRVSIEFTKKDNTECPKYRSAFFLLPHNSHLYTGFK